MADTELQSFIEATCSESHLRIEEDLGDGFVRLRTDEAQRRQAAQDIRCSEDIAIELLRNSRDAHARSIYLACSKEGSMRSITVLDDGDGIPGHLHELVFEPRVTSKLDTMQMDAWGVHGRGMALYSVRANALSAQVMHSEPGLGTAISVQTDTAKLPEKTDQSSFPRFIRTETGTIALRGPKNIVRTVCEFALEQKSKVQLFIGSPAEIASALYWSGKSLIQPAYAIFASDDDALPITLLLPNTGDPEEFAQLAEKIGLPLSERTARRIMDGQIPPAEPILVRIAEALADACDADGARSAQGSVPSKWKKRTRSAAGAFIPKIAPRDVASIVDSVSKAYSDLAGKYYLDPDVEIASRQRNGTLRIEVPLYPLE